MYLLLISCARAKDLTGFSTFDTSKNPRVHKGVTYTVYGILTSIKLLIGLCLQSLHHRFIACTKTARMLLVLLAGAVRTWKQALFIVQEDDAVLLVSPGIREFFG